MAESIDAFKDFLNSIKDTLTPDIVGAFDEMAEGANRLNTTFTQNRQRIQELMQVVADAVPGITKLGGDINDVFRTLEDVSKATSKNVAASADDAAKLFAASKILETSVENIVSKFADAGVQFSQIGPQLEKSIGYIQSIGGNASQIMGDVRMNMSKLNEYNFSEGVVGLTKMAAQASMLRFDMGQAFTLADKAMSPEGAIDLASAFQRMGVAVGDLTDPFQLMYKSLNDPGGLQDSLVNMTKNYTEFDEKTKSFKMNPAGIMQLKEIASQAGLSYGELSKMALASANLDRTLKQISPTIKFEKEDDRKLLANMATMGKSEYEVNITDEKGKTETKKLSELSQTQVDLLLQQQKEKQNLSLEDVQRNQLGTQKLMLADLGAIRDKVQYGLVSTDVVRREAEGFRRFASNITNSIEKNIPKTDSIRGEATEILNKMSTIATNIGEGKGSKTAAQDFKNLEDQLENIAKKSGGVLQKIIADAEKGAGTKSSIEKFAAKTLYGGAPMAKDAAKTSLQKIEYGGTVTFKVDAPPNVDKREIENYINSDEFKKKVYDVLLNMDSNARANLKKTGF